jgi:CRP-like cAMP-binding protein
VLRTSSVELDTVFAEHGRHREFRAGEVLFREADSSNHVYACIRGRVRLVVSAACGRELVLDVKLPGDVFGELSAIDGGRRSTGAVAMASTEVLELPGARFLAVVLADARVGHAALRALSHDLRTANVRICSGETEPVVTRTARLLLDLAERFTDDAVGRHCWTVPITQTDLAEWLGATREATSRSLGTLRRAGLISTARNCVTVHDRVALAELVHSG